MKRFIIFIFFIILSFQARAQSTIYDCHWLDIQIKVENPFFGLIGKRKIFLRNEGQWIERCLSNDAIVTDDSFKCYYSKKSQYDYFIFDEIKKEFRAIYRKSGASDHFSKSDCKVVN